MESKQRSLWTLWPWEDFKIQTWSSQRTGNQKPKTSDRQNNEHIRENRTKNRTNIRQNRILQKKPNIFFFILLELYWIIRPSIFVLILHNNQTKLHSWCLWMCFKNIKCYPQQQLGTFISMFTVHWILQNYYILHYISLSWVIKLLEIKLDQG